MAKAQTYPLIFTDLDGTLLDHHSYSASPADALIARLHRDDIAQVIPITSKTRSELAHLRATIPIEHGVGVTENGSVIDDAQGIIAGDLGKEQAIILGQSYTSILAALAQLPAHIRQHVRGFSDMSAQDIADATGLALGDAKRAAKREASEPFTWSGNADGLAELTEIMAGADVQVQQGGRFYHLTGHATKAMAMAKIAAISASNNPDRHIVSIALGDGPNDLGMIEAANFGVIMPNPDGVTIGSSQEGIRTAPHPGPVGWVAAVQNILTELGLIGSES